MADTDAFLALYQNLIRNGMSPLQAMKIASQPSQSEQQVLQGQAHPGVPFGAWPYPYAGAQQDVRSGMVEQRDEALNRQLWDMRTAQQQNIPQWEGNPLGYDDNLGLRRLPSGQYLPGWTQPQAPLQPLQPMAPSQLQPWQPPPGLLNPQ